MPDGSPSTLQSPRWSGVDGTNASLDAALAELKERFGHDEETYQQYEDALRGQIERVPRKIIADTAVLYARLSKMDAEHIAEARKTGWACAWDFPELLDWMDGDDPAQLDKWFEAIDHLMCGEEFTWEGRSYTLVYIHREDDTAEQRILGLAACPSIYIA